MMKPSQGFTLIELMIVVAIIGVLTATAIPTYQNYIKKTEVASALATLKALITPAELWYLEKNGLAIADKSEILTYIGATEAMNPLGELDIGTANTLTFRFGDNASIENDVTINYVRETQGWICSISNEAYAHYSCPYQ